MIFRLRLNPITKKRLRRFREMKRAWFSFWLLVLLYAISLGAELICNSVPLYVRCNGASYFPVFRFYPEDVFTGSGRLTRPDYRALAASPLFAGRKGNFMLWPPIPHGPYEVTDLRTLEARGRVTVRIVPEPRVGSVRVNEKLSVVRALAAASFFDAKNDAGVRGLDIERYWELPPAFRAAIRARFADRASPAIAAHVVRQDRSQAVEASLPPYRRRGRKPRLVKITLRDRGQAEHVQIFAFAENGKLIHGDPSQWAALPAAVRERLEAAIRASAKAPQDPIFFHENGARRRALFEREQIRFPFRPCPGHWLGIDNAGRDVFARILYGLRTSMTFGLVLVVCSLCLGTMAGAVQGYFGGLVDILGQRLTEIWSALPFLYIMILMGSIYGPGFLLLIFCYGLFNWIGMSYYMRAEMLRLRHQPFVEAARCLGLPAWKIMFRHILPNGLVPLITLFPFSLVGAIGSLAALDYLGFGLPPPTPSWGELLAQAQSMRWAWWLILYPSLALFLVMLLGVFVGEGIRNAFDPRRFSKLQ